MKYIIDVPDEHTDIKVFYTDADMKIIQSMRCEPYTEPDRKATEDEVWEFVWKIDSMNIGEFAEIFDDNECPSDYQEAKAKYEAWLKQKDKLNFGDEIISVDDDVKAVMLDCADYESIYVMTENGCVERWKDLDGVKKTGRTFPEVAELLEKMRREEE